MIERALLPYVRRVARYDPNRCRRADGDNDPCYARLRKDAALRIVHARRYSVDEMRQHCAGEMIARRACGVCAIEVAMRAGTREQQQERKRARGGGGAALRLTAAPRSMPRAYATLMQPSSALIRCAMRAARRCYA